MILRHEKDPDRMNLDEFFTFLEHDPEHGYELIDGIPYMMTGGSPDHSIIGGNIYSALRNGIGKRPHLTFNSDVYIDLADDEHCLCPDASVSCDPRDRHAKKVVSYPCVVAEVLSPSTAERDRGTKVDLYQKMPSVQEILLVDYRVMRIQHFHRVNDGWFMRNYTNAEDRIELASLNSSFTVAEIYEKTTFDETLFQTE